ncbi:MAG: hypothetical protein L0I29_05810, partial [Hyphomicrobiales bacterium]|nr:hypothetical protein [Hyphomicrobiales bacterium]
KPTFSNLLQRSADKSSTRPLLVSSVDREAIRRYGIAINGFVAAFRCERSPDVVRRKVRYARLSEIAPGSPALPMGLSMLQGFDDIFDRDTD